MIKRIIFLCGVVSVFWLSPAFGKNPVLLLHGINSDSSIYSDGCVISTLKNAGYDEKEIFTLNFDNKGHGLIQEDVKKLKEKIDEIKSSTGAHKVDIIAHSRGGLVAELYTMMYDNQYRSTMKYLYSDTKGHPQEKTITGIPRYGNDINQIIMLGTPNKGSGWSNLGYSLPMIGKWIHKRDKSPDLKTVGVEQLKTNSNFMEDLFWKNRLNPTVTYIQLAEDRILGGDGVVSYDSAMGVELHQQNIITKRLEELGIINSVVHKELYKNPGVKRQILQEVFPKATVTAQIRISQEPPVREGKITVDVTTSESLPALPELYVSGQGQFGMTYNGLPFYRISLSGSGKNFSGTLTIPKRTDGTARLYFPDNTKIPVKIASENCEEEITTQLINVPITGEFIFLIDTEEPEVKDTTPKDDEVITVDEVPYKVNISATLFDPLGNGYASGIDNSTIKLDTPQGSFKQASAVNNLGYGEYTCSIMAKDNANESGHDLKKSPYRWTFNIVPPIEVVR